MDKTKTMAFIGKQPVRTMIVMDGRIMEQVQHYSYLGCYVTCETEIDLDEKLMKFRNICGTIHRYLKNKTKKETRIRFFNTVAVPGVMYGDEARVMTEIEKAQIQAAEMKFMGSTVGCTILDRKKIVDIKTGLALNHCWNG